MAKPQRGLGKGYSALFNDFEDNTPVEIEESSGVSEIELSKIDRNLEQARKTFNEESLQEMATSMKLHGVLQPLLLKKKNDGRYEIIAGERRFRSATIAGLAKVPALVKDLSEQEINEISLIENLQREDLNAIEAAEGIRQLMKHHNLKQEDAAQRLGKSRSYIANTMRLLSLPDEVLDLVKDGKLTSGHARALITIEDKEYLKELARSAVEFKWSVREIEERVRLYYVRQEKLKNNIKPKKETQSLELKEMVSDMKRIFGTRIKLAGNDKKGRIVIDYFSSDDLERIYSLVQELKEKQD